MTDEIIDVWYKTRMKQEAVIEDLWLKGFKKFFKAQKKRFIKKVEEANKSVAEEYGIDVIAEMGATVEVIEPLMYETVMTGVKQASELVGQPAIADFEFLREWLDKVGEDIGEKINNTTITAFDKTLQEGIAKGDSVIDLKKRVEKVFDFAVDTRAEMIARTESARGITEAHRQTYEYYGFENVEWLLSPGACEICVAKATELWTTQSINGEIPVHPNCKCDFVPIVLT